MSQSSTEVAERGPIDLATVPEAIKSMLSRLDVAASMASTGTAQLDIMAHILTAESEEEIFAAANAGTVSGQSVAGRPFLLKEFDWKRSAPAFVAQGAFPFYALCRVSMIDTGEDAVLDCGGFTFVSVLDKLDTGGYLETAEANKLGGFPLVLEARAMQSGFTVLIPHKYKAPAPAK